MTAADLIEQFKALPPAEQAIVSRYIMENAHTWLPDLFDEDLTHAEPGGLDDPDIAAPGPHSPK